MMASVGGARASDKPTEACYKFQCDPCAFSGLVKEAGTFCKQCEEYMCVTCESAHRGSKLTRNHTMVSGSDLASTGQSVSASRSTQPESTGPSDVDQPVATSDSACPEYRCKSWLDVEVASSNVPSNDVTGSAVMPDGRVILVDRQNRQIILLDNDFTVQSTLTLPGKPWDDPYDVAMYSDNAAVVTLQVREKLQYVYVDTTLRPSHTIPTGLECYGVAVHDGEIYVGVWGGHVQVMDTRGNVTRRIGAGAHVGDPWCILDAIRVTVGTGGAVYISDNRNNHITCYTSAGDVVYDVKLEHMSHPEGMLVDKDGNQLVCCFGSNIIQVLGKDGAHHRVILSWAHGMVNPHSVSYRRSDQTLIVTMYTTPSVRAYKLKLK